MPEIIVEGCSKKTRSIGFGYELNELRIPSGNRLEPLAGARRGQHSIRINKQYRICFTWTETGPEQAEIVDYH